MAYLSTWVANNQVLERYPIINETARNHLFLLFLIGFSSFGLYMVYRKKMNN